MIKEKPVRIDFIEILKQLDSQDALALTLTRSIENERAPQLVNRRIGEVGPPRVPCRGGGSELDRMTHT